MVLQKYQNKTIAIYGMGITGCSVAETLNKLGAKGRTYPAKRMTGTFQRMHEKTLPAPSELKLKTQAKVMMTRNDPKGRWVNGSSGVIIGLDDDVIKVKIGKYVRNVERETWEDIGHEEGQGEVVEVIKGRFEQFPIVNFEYVVARDLIDNILKIQQKFWSF